MKFEEPILEIIYLENDDIVTISLGTDLDSGDDWDNLFGTDN